MKTIIKDDAGGMTDGLILRLSDEKAANQVKNHHYKYCPKSVWKKQVRDKKKVLDKA